MEKYTVYTNLVVEDTETFSLSQKKIGLLYSQAGFYYSEKLSCRQIFYL